MTKTAAIVCASEFNETDFLSRNNSGAFDVIIAVDAGFANLQAQNITPDIVLGDFDSLGFVPEDIETRVFPSEKDQSDFQLALDYADEIDVDTIWVYGVLGNRLDHSFAAIQVAGQTARCGIDIELVGTDMNVKPLFNAAFEVPVTEVGKVVSVFSGRDLSKGVCITGLKYNVSDIALSNITSLGLSNETMGTPATVEVKNGLVYIFYEH